MLRRRTKMGFIVDIEENEQRKIIRYTRYPLYLWCLLSGLAIGMIGETWIPWAWALAAPLFLIAFAIVIPCWKYNGEIKRAMRSGGIKLSGSKWSFSNPLTVEITKRTNKDPDIL